MTRIVLVCALALSLSPAAAQPAGGGGGTTAAKSALQLQLPDVQTFTLPNGLQVAVLPVDTAPIVAVHLWYHAGSKDEPADRRGSAHMFEHIMFKGTKHVPSEEHAALLNRLGGYVNAQTEEDATHYINVLPSAYVDFAIELEAERMRNLLFRADMIDTEREVVKEEIRKLENSPIQQGFWHFLKLAYTKHPYAWTSGGAIADLDKTTPEDLQKFYDAYYQPNNALLVVVGRTTVEEVKASAEKHFGAIEKGPTPPRPADALVEPEQTEKRREVVDPSQVGLVFAGFKIPAAKDPDTYSLQVAAIILGSGESSRLKTRIKSLVDKKKQPIGIDAGLEIRLNEHPGFMVTVGVFRDPTAADKIEATLFDEIGKLAAKPPTTDELRKAKNQIQAFFVTSLEDVDGLATQIGRSWILTGDGTQWVKDLAEFEKVSAADVQRVVKKYMTTERATVVVIPPKGP